MASIFFPKIRAYNKDLIVDAVETIVNLDCDTGVSEITVESITGLGVGDYVLLGEFGQIDAEIVRLHPSTAPSGTTITLSAATTYAHERGTHIYRIDRNQVEFSRATTLTGSKSVLSTVSINAQSEYTVYEDSTNTTGYGFYRYVNSGDTTYTNYSESFPYAGHQSGVFRQPEGW